MNLIPCYRRCTHQRDGYCALNHITELTGAVVKDGCPYYAVSETPAVTGSKTGYSDSLDGLVKISDSDYF